jgi:hypothetical protein
MVAGISSSKVSKWADIKKTDLQDALSKVGGKGGDSAQPADIDDTFSALDGDSDGKVTKSELTEAITKLSDQLNDQFDASRVGGGGPHGPHGAGHAGGGEDSATAADGSEKASRQKDPMRELAHALHLLKAYAENSGSDASAASTGDAGSSTGSSVSVEA